jgi:hypothetical protein
MASLVWGTVFIFLLLELAFTLILVIPLPRKWRNWLCHKCSKLDLKAHLQKPLLFIGIALTLALLDCFSRLQMILDMEKESHNHAGGNHHGGEEVRVLHQLDKEREYKTERNIYLAGFSLTLLFVIGRITNLMQEHAELEDDLEKIRLSSKAVDSSTGEAGNVEIEMKPIQTKKND